MRRVDQPIHPVFGEVGGEACCAAKAADADPAGTGPRPPGSSGERGGEVERGTKADERGAGEVSCFAAAVGVRFLVRLVDLPRQRLPLRFYEVVFGRGPFRLPEERHLLERHAIDVLVCKASGGAATEAKIVAARELGVSVVMVRRPPPEPGDAVETIEAALDWLAEEHSFPRVERVS